MSYEAPPLDPEIEELLRTAVTADPIDTDAVAEGNIVAGRIHETDDDYVYVAFGDDQFGRCPHEDTSVPGVPPSIEIGAEVRVLLDTEFEDGTWDISIAKAQLLDAYEAVASWKKDGTKVHGRINLVTRGGFAVEAHGLRCFLPGRESGIRRAEAFEAVGSEFEFEVISFDPKIAEPVLSRRSLAESERRAGEREIMANLVIGAQVEGRVASIKPFGVFVDIGGVDGLCHVSELTLAHVEHPSEVVSVGQTITVRITEVDVEKGRIGLSRRDLLGAEKQARVAELEAGTIVEGKVTRLAEFGAFIELEEGIEGLCHVSELSYTERHDHPSAVLTEGQAITVKILSVDAESGRISLSLRATQANPWTELPELGSVVDGEITRIEDYGVFVRIADGIEGLCHISDLTWEGRPDRPSDAGDFAVGAAIQVKILSVDSDKGRISLGIKQLQGDPWDDAGERATEGTIFTAPIVRFDERAAYVQVAEKLEGRLHISQISDERVDSVRAALRLGQEVEVMVMSADRNRRRLDVSIKAVLEKIEAETPKSFSDDDKGMNPLAAAFAASTLVTEPGEKTPEEPVEQAAAVEQPAAEAAAVEEPAAEAAAVEEPAAEAAAVEEPAAEAAAVEEPAAEVAAVEEPAAEVAAVEEPAAEAAAAADATEEAGQEAAAETPANDADPKPSTDG